MISTVRAKGTNNAIIQPAKKTNGNIRIISNILTVVSIFSLVIDVIAFLSSREKTEKLLSVFGLSYKLVIWVGVISMVVSGGLSLLLLYKYDIMTWGAYLVELVE